jgi:hypothetical protein
MSAQEESPTGSAKMKEDRELLRVCLVSTSLDRESATEREEEISRERGNMLHASFEE